MSISIFPCPNCRGEVDWMLFNGKEEMKKYHETLLCKKCQDEKDGKTFVLKRRTITKNV